MIVLPGVELTVRGRPRLYPGEIEQGSLDKADIQFKEQGGVAGCMANKHEDGLAVLTTHRLVWIDQRKAPAAGATCQVHLETINNVELRSSRKWSHSKLRIQVHLDHEGRPASGQKSYTRIEEFKLSSRGLSSSTFPDRFRSVLYRRAWEPPMGGGAGGVGDINHLAAAQSRDFPQQGSFPHHVAPSPGRGEVDPGVMRQLTGMGFPEERATQACLATRNSGTEPAVQWMLEHEGDPTAAAPPPPLHPAAPAGGYGIAGILRREQEIAARNDRTLDEAFQDLRGLMANAQEMVHLAERFRETLAARGGGAGADGEVTDPEMQRELIEMGIASPVTKDTAGASYHQQLSRELADFLRPRMAKAGGIITLADVYCLFNRARGTELISPDDLLQAVGLFPSHQAGMHARTFPSGVVVVQSDSHDDNEVCARVAEMVRGEGCGRAISASEVAAALSVPLTIASHHLATAEAKAVLCRDDGPQGLRFFRNFFEEVAL